MRSVPTHAAQPQSVSQACEAVSDGKIAPADLVSAISMTIP
jgi:hypothetical protein